MAACGSAAYSWLALSSCARAVRYRIQALAGRGGWIAFAAGPASAPSDREVMVDDGGSTGPAFATCEGSGGVTVRAGTALAEVPTAVVSVAGRTPRDGRPSGRIRVARRGRPWRTSTASAAAEGSQRGAAVTAARSSGRLCGATRSSKARWDGRSGAERAQASQSCERRSTSRRRVPRVWVPGSGSGAT